MWNYRDTNKSLHFFSVCKSIVNYFVLPIFLAYFQFFFSCLCLSDQTCFYKLFKLFQIFLALKNLRPHFSSNFIQYFWLAWFLEPESFWQRMESWTKIWFAILPAFLGTWWMHGMYNIYVFKKFVKLIS